MPKSERQKLKLLYLRDYLCKNTDEAHPAGMQSIIDYLAAQGIPAERKSIYDDIQNLNDYGIQVLYKGGRYGGYYVAQRDFELHELKLLVDAVLSSRFLSSKKSMQLIKKIAALSSSHESELLRRELVISGRLKTRERRLLRCCPIRQTAIFPPRCLRTENKAMLGPGAAGT